MNATVSIELHEGNSAVIAFPFIKQEQFGTEWPTVTHRSLMRVDNNGPFNRYSHDVHSRDGP